MKLWGHHDGGCLALFIDYEVESFTLTSWWGCFPTSGYPDHMPHIQGSTPYPPIDWAEIILESARELQ